MELNFVQILVTKIIKRFSFSPIIVTKLQVKLPYIVKMMCNGLNISEQWYNPIMKQL